MSVKRRRPDADVSSRNIARSLYKRQLGLKLICVLVAAVDRFEDGPWVASFRHEQLRSIVGELILIE